MDRTSFSEFLLLHTCQDRQTNKQVLGEVIRSHLFLKQNKKLKSL